MYELNKGWGKGERELNSELNKVAWKEGKMSYFGKAIK